MSSDGLRIPPTHEEVCEQEEIWDAIEHLQQHRWEARQLGIPWAEVKALRQCMTYIRQTKPGCGSDLVWIAYVLEELEPKGLLSDAMRAVLVKCLRVKAAAETPWHWVLSFADNPIRGFPTPPDRIITFGYHETKLVMRQARDSGWCRDRWIYVAEGVAHDPTKFEEFVTELVSVMELVCDAKRWTMTVREFHSPGVLHGAQGEPLLTREDWAVLTHRVATLASTCPDLSWGKKMLCYVLESEIAR
jgi:hypothetical protein